MFNNELYQKFILYAKKQIGYNNEHSLFTPLDLVHEAWDFQETNIRYVFSEIKAAYYRIVISPFSHTKIKFEDPIRQCKRCYQILPLYCFGFIITNNTFKTACKTCSANSEDKEAKRIRYKEYYDKRGEYLKDRKKLKRKAGIVVDSTNAERQRNYWIKQKEQLSDKYIVKIMKSKKNKTITPEMIEIKRNELKNK